MEKSPDPEPQATNLSFDNIPTPLVKAKKAPTTAKGKLPKAATGEAFRALLAEKKRQKEEEEKAKEERKNAREAKKRRLQEEKQRKKEEREEKKRKKQALILQMTQEMNASDDDAEPLDVNRCYKCSGPFMPSEADQWIGCNRCPRWFHKSCVDADISNMSDAEIEEFYFECLYC